MCVCVFAEGERWLWCQSVWYEVLSVTEWVGRTTACCSYGEDWWYCLDVEGSRVAMRWMIGRLGWKTEHLRYSWCIGIVGDFRQGSKLVPSR